MKYFLFFVFLLIKFLQTCEISTTKTGKRKPLIWANEFEPNEFFVHPRHYYATTRTKRNAYETDIFLGMMLHDGLGAVNEIDLHGLVLLKVTRGRER